ncbi:hypothetical protein IWZ01DRAFT_110175 [Phyllosticta capitalensis]
MMYRTTLPFHPSCHHDLPRPSVHPPSPLSLHQQSWTTPDPCHSSCLSPARVGGKARQGRAGQSSKQASKQASLKTTDIQPQHTPFSLNGSPMPLSASVLCIDERHHGLVGWLAGCCTRGWILALFMILSLRDDVLWTVVAKRSKAASVAYYTCLPTYTTSPSKFAARVLYDEPSASLNPLQQQQQQQQQCIKALQRNNNQQKWIHTLHMHRSLPPCVALLSCPAARLHGSSIHETTSTLCIWLLPLVDWR